MQSMGTGCSASRNTAHTAGMLLQAGRQRPVTSSYSASSVAGELNWGPPPAGAAPELLLLLVSSAADDRCEADRMCKLHMTAYS